MLVRNQYSKYRKEFTYVENNQGQGTKNKRAERTYEPKLRQGCVMIPKWEWGDIRIIFMVCSGSVYFSNVFQT